MTIREKYKAIIEGMKSDERSVQWNTMVKWCQLWIEEEKRELKPLLQLIKHLKEIQFWDKYYPSQSHTAIGISLEKDYDKRYDSPMVYIRYLPSENNFSIQYQKGQGGETILENCQGFLAEGDFEKIELWLNDVGNGRTSTLN